MTSTNPVRAGRIAANQKSAMSRSKAGKQTKGGGGLVGKTGSGTLDFAWGDPEPVLNGRAAILGLLENRWNGRFYEPPIPLNALAQAMSASPHHSSALFLKRNLLAGSFVPNRWLSRAEFRAFALDFLALGNGVLEKVPNRLGGTAMLQRVPAKAARRGKNAQSWFLIEADLKEHEFAPGSIIHVRQDSLDQEIYGVPEYLSCMQSVFLNENATLFRRKYYLNGSHAGYILHLNGEFGDGVIETLKAQLKASKGPGNFRNILIHSTGDAKEAVKMIPISEVAAKDEFLGIKNATRDDILAAHRVPPQLIGVVPANAAGFGDVAKATTTFFELEILPLQMMLSEVNEALGYEAVRFLPREVAA